MSRRRSRLMKLVTPKPAPSPITGENRISRFFDWLLRAHRPFATLGHVMDRWIQKMLTVESLGTDRLLIGEPSSNAIQETPNEIPLVILLMAIQYGHDRLSRYWSSLGHARCGRRPGDIFAAHALHAHVRTAVARWAKLPELLVAPRLRPDAAYSPPLSRRTLPTGRGISAQINTDNRVGYFRGWA